MTVTTNIGRFRKGERRSPKTEFKTGQHWRPVQEFRERDWLEVEYLQKGRSTGDIAAQFDVTDAAIFFWLKRHNIPRRTITEARKLKRWGSMGDKNPMYGRRGPDHPGYIDGSTPERQTALNRSEGRLFTAAVLRRDNYQCRRCGSANTGSGSLHAHHIKSWAKNIALRFDLNNAITLCRRCHGWVHSKRNAEREYIL